MVRTTPPSEASSDSAAAIPNSYAVRGPLSYHKGCVSAHGKILRDINIYQPTVVPQTGSGMGGRQIYYMGFGPQVIKRRGPAIS